MRRILVPASCALVLLLSTSAMAGETQSSNTKVQTEQVSARLICRAPIHEGQLLVRAKQCYTAREWQARKVRMQQSVRDLQTRALTVNNGK